MAHTIRPLHRLALLSCLFLAAGPGLATQVRPLNLEEMTTRAHRIFLGRCVDVQKEAGTTAGMTVLRVTFAVEQAAKGVAGETVTVRMPVPYQGGGGTVSAATSFVVGEEVVLFLYGESGQGLTSPVGLGQGRFRISDGKDGRRVAVNATGNATLMSNLSEGGARRVLAQVGDLSEIEIGAVGPERLLDLVRALEP